MLNLSIIIPCYNEEKQINKTLKELILFLKKQSWTTEIVIANDGSRDSTVSLAKETFTQYNWDQYSFIEHFPNHGRGAILTKAFLMAKGQYVIYMDADMPIDLSYLNDMMGAFNSGYILVTGSRHLRKSKIERSLFRGFLSRGYNYLVRLFFWDGIKDHQCGFKGMNSKVIPYILQIVESSGWFWDTELLVLSKKLLGLRIKEIPVYCLEYRDKGESKVRLLHIIPKFFIEIFWLKKKLRRLRQSRTGKI